MATSKRFRVIIIENGEEYIFNPKAFDKLILEKKASSEKDDSNNTIEKIISNISEKTNVSEEGVRKWRKGNNGPSEGKIVKKIADYFDVDYHILLTNKKEFDFDIDNADEKGIIIKFYKLLLDFIYTYVGGYIIPSDKAKTIVPEDAELEFEIDNYIFDLYRLLDSVALDISENTYEKLHRFISECKALGRMGNWSLYLEFSDWACFHERWGSINPKLYVASLYAEQCFHDKFEEQQQLEEDCIKEMGFEPYINSSMDPDGRKAQLEEIFLPSEYEVLIMELAKTLKLLFISDFSQYFKNRTR